MSGWQWLCVVSLIIPSTALADEGPLAEVGKAIEEYGTAYQSGSVEKVMDFWTEDADFVDIRGTLHQGRDLIAALFRRGFADNPGRTIRLTSDVRKSLASDVVMDDGILELIPAEGEAARGRYAVIWVRQDGRWRIRSARDIPLDVIEDPAEEKEVAALEELAWLVGKWKAESDKYRINLECSWILDQSFLRQTFQISSDTSEFTVLTLITFDPVEQTFHSWYFDSRGGFGSGLWSREGETWSIQIDAVLPDGQPGTSVMTWRLVDDMTAEWQAINREIGGEPIPDAQQIYRRVAE